MISILKKTLLGISVFFIGQIGASTNHERVIIIAPPKSGAHLVAEIITILTGKVAVFNESCMNIDNTELNESFLYLPDSKVAGTHIFHNQRNKEKLKILLKIFL